MPALALFLLATQLQSLLNSLHWAVVLYDCVRYRQWGLLPEQFLAAAYMVDLTENVSKAQLLNLLFVKRNGLHYGHKWETISSKTGKNWTLKRATLMGEGLVWTLDKLDPDHCYKHITPQPWPYPKPAPVKAWKGWLFVVCTALLLTVLWSLRWLWRAGVVYVAWKLYNNHLIH